MTFLFCLPSLNFYLRHIELHLYSASCELAHTYRSSLGCWLMVKKRIGWHLIVTVTKVHIYEKGVGCRMSMQSVTNDPTCDGPCPYRSDPSKRWPEEELWSGSYTATDGRIWRSDRCMVKQARCRIIVMLSVAMYEWSRVLHPGETNHRRWAAAGRVGQWGACTTDEAVSFSPWMVAIVGRGGDSRRYHLRGN